MYKKVENEIERTMFNFIWMTAWREKGYEFEFTQQALEQYLLLSKEGQYAGTVEFRSYNPRLSELDQIAPFYEHPLIKQDYSKVAEIDKVALLPEFRGEYIAELLSSTVHFAEEHHYHYYISLLEPVFCRALKISFHVPLLKLGGKIFYKGDYVIPVIFDMKTMYEHPEKFDWLIGNPVTQTA